MNSEYYAMKPSFFGKWIAKREAARTDAGRMGAIMAMKADSLDDQFKRVWKVEGRTGTISINGPLSPDGPDELDVLFGYGGTAYKNIVRAASEARAAYDSGAIEKVEVLINSPGGSLDGLDATYQALTEISDIATAYNAGNAASAAYWLASAFSRIEPLTPTAAAGSIGVVATIQDYSGYLDYFGIKEIAITNTESPNKRPDVLTPEGVEVIRKELDGYYDVFVDRVTATRPLSRDQIDSLKGEMLISRRAVEFGLMDAPPHAETATAEHTITMQNKGGATMDTIKAEMAAPTADQITPIVTENKPDFAAERSRITGLLKVSGASVPAEVLAAIETGVDVGAFAVAKAEADAAKLAIKAAEEKAEVEAARSLRTAVAPAVTGVKASKPLNTADGEAEKIDALVDSTLKRKGM